MAAQDSEPRPSAEVPQLHGAVLTSQGPGAHRHRLRPRRARPLRAGLAQVRELGERSWEDVIWDTLGFIHRRLGDYQQSVTCYRRAIEICQEGGDRFNEASALDVLGDTHQKAGSEDDARQAWMQALRIFDELGQLDHPGADKIRAKLQPPGAQATGRQPDPAADPDAPVGTAS